MFDAVFTLSAMPRKNPPQSEKKVPIAARINPKLEAKLHSISQAEERTLSWLVERAIREYLERRDRGK